MKSITEQQKTLGATALKGFFFVLKTITVVLLILTGVLVISQSSVSPVSMRLLSTYAIEYTVQKVKPYRIYFPRPYMINLEEKTR